MGSCKAVQESVEFRLGLGERDHSRAEDGVSPGRAPTGYVLRLPVQAGLPETYNAGGQSVLGVRHGTNPTFAS